jgi:hypothetical protein
MTDPRSITADACEILVIRELRKAGIEPLGLRRRHMQSSSHAAHLFNFDLLGRLQAYDQRWTVLIECRNSDATIVTADVQLLQTRAQTAEATSCIFCTTSEYQPDALRRASDAGVLLLRVVDAQSVLVAAGVIVPGQLPSWVPEFTLQIVSARSPAHPRLVEADQPELILSELRGA